VLASSESEEEEEEEVTVDADKSLQTSEIIVLKQNAYI